MRELKKIRMNFHSRLVSGDSTFALQNAPWLTFEQNGQIFTKSDFEITSSDHICVSLDRL